MTEQRGLELNLRPHRHYLNPWPVFLIPTRSDFMPKWVSYSLPCLIEAQHGICSLQVQLVGHEEKYMKSVENDVPAIRNGLLIFFNQQEFEVVNTYEGREALRRKTLQRVNEIIGASGEDRVADVYFTAYITQ
jgi:hypothetical protein